MSRTSYKEEAALNYDTRMTLFERALLSSLLLLTTLISLRTASSHPIAYDEAYTYLQYVSRPWLHLLSQYNHPNNHILFSLLAKASLLLFESLHFSLRFPSVVAAVAFSIAAFLFNRQCGTCAAIGCLAAFTCPLSSPYFGAARGYSLVILFSGLQLLALNWALKTSKKSYYYLYAFSSSLGIFSVPLMVLCYIPAILFFTFQLLQQNHQKSRQMIRPFLEANALSLALAALFYSPILAQGGSDILLSYERYRAALSLESFPYLFRTLSQIARELTWPHVALILSGIIGAMTSLSRQRALTLFFMLFLGLLSISSASLLLGTFTKNRFFSFLLPAIYLLSARGLASFSQSSRLRALLRTAIFFTLLSAAVAAPGKSIGGTLPEAAKVANISNTSKFQKAKIVALSLVNVHLAFYFAERAMDLDRIALLYGTNALKECRGLNKGEKLLLVIDNRRYNISTMITFLKAHSVTLVDTSLVSSFRGILDLHSATLERCSKPVE